MLRFRQTLRLSAVLLLASLSLSVRADGGDTAPADEAADRQAVLQAWEQSQRSDPLTVSFEPTAPGTYHLKTTRFPYDGTVRVSSIVVHRFNEPLGNGSSKYAIVEPTLDQDNVKLLNQYPESFNDWRRRNSFYYKAESKTWINQADMHFTPSRSGLNPVLWFYVLVGSVALFIIGLGLLRLREWRAVQKRFKQAEGAEQRMEETLRGAAESRERAAEGYAIQRKNHELFLEQNRLLREILEILKAGKA